MTATTQHLPKFRCNTQRVINACQAVEGMAGTTVVMTLEGVSQLTASGDPADIEPFIFTENPNHTFTVTLKS